MKGLLIIGAGGNGRVIADMAEDLGHWSKIAFLDDELSRTLESESWQIIGPCSALAEIADDFDDVVIAFGDNALRYSWIERAMASSLELATVIAPSASVSSHAHLGPGTVVMPQAVVNVGAKIGSCGLINTGSSVDHDCVLGDAVHVAPGARLGGDVTIGDRTWIGLGAAVRHGIVIGQDVLVGAGAAVVNNLPSSCTAMGVPARVRSEK